MVRRLFILIALILLLAYVSPAECAEMHSSNDMYDSIIVGGGTAGSIAASRLSELGSRKVLLIAAGEYMYDSRYAAIPLLDPVRTENMPTDFTRLVYPILSIEGPGLGRRSPVTIVPNTVGGGSMVNGGAFQTPARQDGYEMLSLGLPEWGPDANIATMQQIEKCEPFPGAPCSPGRGTTGRIQVRTITPDTWLNVAMSSAQLVLGTSFIPDMGLGDINGTGRVPRPLGGNASTEATGDYFRQDSYTMYIKPHLGRRNLDVVLGATVTHIARDAHCSHRTRSDACYNTVHYTKAGKCYTARIKAGGKIILSAGALGTPKILFQSGVGDCDFLAKRGVACTRNITSVGKNLQEQPNYSMLFLLPFPSPTWRSHIGSIISSYYSANRTDTKVNIESSMTMVPYGAIASFMASNPWAQPMKDDVEAFQARMSTEDGRRSIAEETVAQGPNGKRGVSAVTEVQEMLASMTEYSAQLIVFQNILNRPVSRGEVNMRDSDWGTILNLTLGMFSEPADIPPLITSLDNSRRIMADPRFPVVIEVSPGAAAISPSATYDQKIAWMKGRANPDWHITGTTSMGKCEQGSVINSRLRLCGAANVLIADNGVMPFAPTAHSTDASARIIGERVVQFFNDLH